MPVTPVPRRVPYVGERVNYYAEGSNVLQAAFVASLASEMGAKTSDLLLNLMVIETDGTPVAVQEVKMRKGKDKSAGGWDFSKNS